jgi:hypothetical protein
VTFLEHLATVLRHRTSEGTVEAMGLALDAAMVHDTQAFMAHLTYLMGPQPL